MSPAIALDYDAFDSDLTELSSDEEDDEPLASSAPSNPSSSKRKSKLPPPDPSLDPPRSISFSIANLCDLIHDKDINLNPPYQRDVVWNHDKQSNLIDSLFHNFYVPPLLLCRFQNQEGAVAYICIDGKQRLTSLVNFVNGLIPHKDSVSGASTYFVNTSGKKRKVFTEQARKNFMKKQIQCMEYSKLTMEQQRAIFQRVQNGVSLTPAERMQSFNGPAPDLIRRIFSEYPGIFDSKPGPLQFKWVAQALIMINTSPIHFPAKRSTGKAKPAEAEVTASRIETFLQKTTTITAPVQDIFRNVMEILQVLVTHNGFKKPFHGKPELTPLDYIFATHLIHTKRSHLSLAQLSSVFAKIKKDAHKNGSKVSGELYKKIMKDISEARSELQLTPAVVEIKQILVESTYSTDIDMGHITTTSRRVSGVKRERGAPDDDSSTQKKKPKLSKPADDTKDTKPFLAPAKPYTGTSSRGRMVDDDDDEDDGASIRPMKPAKSRTSLSRNSLVGSTVASGASIAATRVRRTSDKSSARQAISTSATANTVTDSYTPQASFKTSALTSATSSPRPPSTPASSAPPTPRVTSCPLPRTVSLQKDPLRTSTGRPSQTPPVSMPSSAKGLSTVAIRTANPRRKPSSSVTAASSPSVSTPPVAVHSGSTHSSPLLGQSPKPPIATAPLYPNDWIPALPATPATSALFDIGSTVTVSSLSASTKSQVPQQIHRQFQHVPQDVLGANVAPLMRKL